jgi:drug/metabolite transporter (DMT)-like permease
MDSAFSFSKKKKTSRTLSCRQLLFSVVTTTLFVLFLHGCSGFATTKVHQKRSHHAHGRTSSAFYDDDSFHATTRREIASPSSKKASADSWTLGASRKRRQVETQGGGRRAVVTSTPSFYWRLKNHTDTVRSSSAFTRRSMRSSTTTAGSAQTAAATSSPSSKTTTELMLHDLLRQHSAYTSDFVSLRHDILQDASAAATAATVAAVAMTTSTTTDSSSSCLSLQPHDDVAAKSQQQTQSSNDQAVFWARWLLVGAAALYGTNFSLVKLLLGAETDIPVGLSTALRFGLAALVTSPFLLLLPPQKSSSSVVAAVAATASSSSDDDIENDRVAAIDATWLGLQVGLCNSIGYVSQAVGLAGTTEAGKSAFICSLAVVVVPFLDVIAGRRLSTKEWVGAACALLGVALLELGDGLFGGAGAIATTAATTVGIGMDDWISLLQPLAFGMGFFLMEKAMRQYPQHASRSTAAQLLAVFVASTIYCMVAESDTFFSATFWMETVNTWLQNPHTLLFLVWTGCISTALSIYMETVALKTLSAAETTLILSTEPLWGAAFATLLIGEQFGLNSAIGGMFIMAGCLYSSLGDVKGFESFLSNKVDTKTSHKSLLGLQPAANLHTKRKELEHYMTASMMPSSSSWSSSSTSSFGKRRKQQNQPQRTQQEENSLNNNIPQLSALAVALAAFVMVAEARHMSDAVEVLSHQVGSFVDGIM